jgi:hypothetical protein
MLNKELKMRIKFITLSLIERVFERHLYVSMTLPLQASAHIKTTYIYSDIHRFRKILNDTTN